MARAMVDFKGDFSEVAEFLGSGQGFAEEVETPYYISDLLRAGHGVASKTFDVETAVVAAAAKGTARSISHMYEWGATGINEGDVGLSPTTEAARLWVHKLGGAGANRSIDFIFRPATQETPLPKGGWDADQAPKNRHVFREKAWITEFGVPVVVNPKNKYGVLFIPLGPEGSHARSAWDAQRHEVDGFVISPYAVTIPGSKNAGNFSLHWVGWWNTEGTRILNSAAHSIVDGEMAATIKRGAGKGRGLRSYTGGAASKAFTLQVSTEKARTHAKLRQSYDTGYRSKYVSADLEENTNAMGGF